VATGSPLYVININGAEGKVTVGGNDDLLSRTLIARDVNWIAIESLADPIRVTAKIRHRHEPAPAVLKPALNGEVRVTFDEPQRAITPGQAVVFYQDDLVVGGGWIAETAR
jgi:tRNA-specific 2-thiouridylase